MKEKKDENVEELAEKLEARLIQKEDNDLEEIMLEDDGDGWLSEDETPEVDQKRNFSEKEFSGKGRKIYISEEEFSEEEFLEDDWEEDEDEEDSELMKPWMMAAAMAGLVILAAVICAILWHFTHLDKNEGGSSQISSAVSATDYTGSDEISGTVLDDGTASGTVLPSEAASDPADSSGESGAAESSGSTASSVPAASSGVTASSASASSEASVSSAPADTPSSTTVQEPISGTTAMEFTQSNADVTPKDVINLRSEPSTLNADNIVTQAKNGDVLSRTGINEATGWTRIDYNGKTLYAVSQYLTTDLTYKPPVKTADPNRVNTLDGRIILFTNCDDNITPKEYVNLRTEPSTSEGQTTVRCQISNGEVVHRTGYSPDAGWSRVEYNGEILYVVSSYMYTVE